MARIDRVWRAAQSATERESYSREPRRAKGTKEKLRMYVFRHVVEQDQIWQATKFQKLIVAYFLCLSHVLSCSVN